MDLDKIVAELKGERDRISRAIGLLEGADLPRSSRKRTAVIKPTTKKQRRGGITPAGRKRLSDAMKKRWAERRKKGR